MKTLLLNCSLIVILFVSCSSPSSSEDNIIREPIRIGRIEVAQNDFPTQMSWGDAVKACENLGIGWRLPTKDELNLLYKNKDKIGGFDPQGYWSSTEDVNGSAWGQGFNDGGHYLNGKNDPNGNYVRAIRSF